MKIHPSKFLLFISALAVGGALLAPGLRAEDAPAADTAPAVQDPGATGSSASTADAAGKKKKKHRKKKKNQEDEGSDSSAPAESSNPPPGSGS